MSGPSPPGRSWNYGQVECVRQVVPGFKRRTPSLEVVGTYGLDMPERMLHTPACGRAGRRARRERGLESGIPGALHAAERAHRPPGPRRLRPGGTWADYPRRSMNRRFPRRCSCTMPSGRVRVRPAGFDAAPAWVGRRAAVQECRVSPGATVHSVTQVRKRQQPSTRRRLRVLDSSRRPSPLRAARETTLISNSPPGTRPARTPPHLAPPDSGGRYSRTCGAAVRAHLRCGER